MTEQVTPECLSALNLPPAQQGGDKDSRGCALVVAGGGGVPGAPLLTGRAALRVGAGKLQLAATPGLAIALGMAMPEAMIVVGSGASDHEFCAEAADSVAAAADEADAACVGPGMLDIEVARGMALVVLSRCGILPCVIDAGALPEPTGREAFAAVARGRVVLTPHAGEMASLLACSKEDVLARPLEAARTAAEGFQSVVVLKGATTLVVTPDGRSWRHDEGVVGLGTSGSGDVLAGVITGLLARSAPPAVAAVWGVYLHAAAGRRVSGTIGSLGFLASDLLPVLPGLLEDLASRPPAARSSAWVADGRP